MSQYLGPDNIPQLVVASTTSLTLAATNNNLPTRITVMGQQYMLTAPLTLSTATSGFGGLDVGSLAANTLYYVYAVVSSNTLGMVLSLSSLAPSGFLQYANIGRVKTFLGSAGLAASANWLNGQLQSAAVSASQNYISTLGGLGAGSYGTNNFTWYRNGDTIVLWGGFQKDTTAGTGSSDVTISLPAINGGLDASRLPLTTVTNSQNNGLGRWNFQGTQNVHGYMIPASTTTLRFHRDDGTGGELSGANIASSAGLNVGPLTIPIAEWAGLYS